MNKVYLCHLPVNFHQNADPTVGDGVPFNRVRRITGYLVGDLRRFNDAKRAEVRDRVKHLHLADA